MRNQRFRRLREREPSVRERAASLHQFRFGSHHEDLQIESVLIDVLLQLESILDQWQHQRSF